MTTITMRHINQYNNKQNPVFFRILASAVPPRCCPCMADAEFDITDANGRPTDGSVVRPALTCGEMCDPRVLWLAIS